MLKNVLCFPARSTDDAGKGCFTESCRFIPRLRRAMEFYRLRPGAESRCFVPYDALLLARPKRGVGLI